MNFIPNIDIKLNECSIRCLKGYEKNKTNINILLEKYKNFLPLLFVIDYPELNNNLFAEIVNNAEFDLLCLSCSYYIIQSYNFNEESLYKRYFTSRYIEKKSLCYN